jgi:hypothetical protein
MTIIIIVIIIIIIIDTSISGGRNMINVRAKSDTGHNKGITKSFRQYLSNIPGNHKINELQKTLLCISRILVLM